MALTHSQKDRLRARVKLALEDPGELIRAEGLQFLRISDPSKGYSLRNTLLLLIQAEERGMTLSMCAGFREWLTLERKVKKGEKGLFITAYSPKKTGDDGGEDARGFWGGTYVWDISQTEPLDGTEEVER